MTPRLEGIEPLFDIEVVEGEIPPQRFNTAPGQQVPIVLESERGGKVTRRLASARWGILPRWAPDEKYSYKFKTFNAVSEKVTTTKTFMGSVKKSRAPIPAQGFYEWDELIDPEAKRPYYFHSADGAPLVFAGLFAWWENPANAKDDPARWVLTTTILTRPPVEPVSHIHHRTPVMLPSEAWDAWLDPSVPGDQAFIDQLASLTPTVADELDWYEVDKAVGNWRNESPLLIEAVGPAV